MAVLTRPFGLDPHQGTSHRILHWIGDQFILVIIYNILPLKLPSSL